jgi:chromate transporter
MPASNPPTRAENQASRLGQVAALFIRLGFTAFGGPAAHVALMYDEVVRRRKWLSEQEFLDLVGAVNIIPGPNSTEIAIHIGLRRAGRLGLIAAGLGFVGPAVAIVLVLAWAYVHYGSSPQVEWLLYGIKPVVIAIIAHALWSLGRKALRTLPLAILGAAVILLYFLGINEIALLFGAGILFMIVTNAGRLRHLRPQLGLLVPGAAASVALASVPFSLPLLFLTFLKIGAVLYGSGYVLFALLRADLVVRYAWITDQQLLDAIAIGQITPGPLFTSATFIGYVLAGVPGALLATLGIFLPSFLFVALSSPLIPRIRSSAWAGAFLDGVNAAALGLMAAVTWQLGLASLVDPLTIVVALAAFSLLLRFKVNSTWLILAGALIGLLARFL